MELENQTNTEAQLHNNNSTALNTASPEGTKSGSENKQKKKRGLDVEILEKPNRILPNLIEELLEKNISVVLAKDGYYVEGFYGLNENIGKKGFAFAREAAEENTLVFMDAKNGKHVVRSFEDLVSFNNHIWGQFFKVSEEYKKPDTIWFSYMLEYGVLNITPGK